MSDPTAGLRVDAPDAPDVRVGNGHDDKNESAGGADNGLAVKPTIATRAPTPAPPPKEEPVSAPTHARTPSIERAGAPTVISMPSVPDLENDHKPWDTNSLALLLPHIALFAPEALQLLRDAFAAYGTLAHWAPVRGMGRVIIVYYDDAAAELAKRECDGLALHVNLDNAAPEPAQGAEGERDFFQQRKATHDGIVLRVYALPRTSLDAEKDHLRPPELERNFLISPPGSPPEGWAPIVEDGPNMAPLADDLRSALEALQLAGSRRGGSGPEVIIDGGGVRVEVEDHDGEKEWYDDDREWGQEEVQTGGPEIWAPPTQTQSPTKPSFSFPGVDGAALGRGPLTPSGRIQPTARPPMPTD